jgi:hypothetical protein
MTRRPGPRRKRPSKPSRSAAPRAVTAAELRALRREIARGARPDARETNSRSVSSRKPKAARQGAGLRWNPESDDVQRSVAQLVLTIVEFLRQLMERQAIRRVGQKTLTRKEAEAVGVALMKLEETVQEIGKKFGLTREDLNLDLGPLKLM